MLCSWYFFVLAALFFQPGRKNYVLALLWVKNCLPVTLARREELCFFALLWIEKCLPVTLAGREELCFFALLWIDLLSLVTLLF